MKEKSLKGQVAIVTGGGTGIGKAISLSLASKGVKVMLASRNKEHLEATRKLIEAQGGEAAIYPMDMGNEKQVVSLVRDTAKLFGGLNIVVNNAASFMGTGKQVTQLTTDQWDAAYTVNVRGPFLLLRESIPFLMKEKNGSIVTINSVGARRCYPNSGLYVSMKHALRAMTVVLSKELRTEAPQIRVHVINPGGTRVESSDVNFKINGRPELLDAKLIDPEEIAEMVMFLVAHKGNGVIDEISIRREDALYFNFE